MESESESLHRLGREGRSEEHCFLETPREGEGKKERENTEK